MNAQSLLMLELYSTHNNKASDRSAMLSIYNNGDERSNRPQVYSSVSDLPVTEPQAFM